MENAILHDFEMSFKQALFIFYFIGTFKIVLSDWPRGVLAWEYVNKVVWRKDTEMPLSN